MARIFIRKHDNHQVASLPAVESERLWHRGDVVDILEDGDPIGAKTADAFQVIHLEGVPAKELAPLLEGDVDKDGLPTQRRIRRLSLTGIAAKVSAAEKENLRQGKPIKLTELKAGEGLQTRRGHGKLAASEMRKKKKLAGGGR